MSEKFNYNSIEEIRGAIRSLGADITLDEDISVLSTPLEIKGKKVENRLAILPMEGCDSELDGAPSDLVKRRYERFFLGGAGLVWWEANAVVEEGRANEHQMMITDENKGEFKAMLDSLKEKSIKANGYAPVSILQLTHSGRYSRPHGHKAAPIVPQRDPILDARSGVVSDEQVCSDEYLDSLIPRYAHSALLAKEAGYDGVDIKACHRYLLSELLASHTRGGKYGGPIENRLSFFVKLIRAVKAEVGEDFIIASRFNVFDAHPYPYGFGEDKENMWKFDPTEPMLYVKTIVKEGVSLLSNSAGNPYYIYPQVTRPFDTSSMGIPTPEEHQLESISRLFDFTSEIQKAAGDVPVIGNGYTWLREYLAPAGAANIKAGKCQMVGLGREAIAYPDAPNDILRKGGMERKKCCITCSKCTQIMRDHGMTGCVIRDSKLYAPKYKQYRAEAEERENG
jgi:NADH:flavin oxidoreductases, Old Yellow Enzyme family